MDYIYESIPNVGYEVIRGDSKRLGELLVEFPRMVGWLISWALHGKRTYRFGNRSFDKHSMERETSDWFSETYYGRYAAHYHEAACSFATQQLDAWAALGGNTSTLPYLTVPMTRLRKDLFKATLEGDGHGMRYITIRITLGPHEYVTIRGRIAHKKLKDYVLGELGEITVFPDHINLVWRSEDHRTSADGYYDFDTNMRSLDGISDDGKVVHVDISKVVEMQDAERQKRKHLQQVMGHDRKKRERLQRRMKGREHERIEQQIRQRIVPDLLKRTSGYGHVFDDLKTTNGDCIIVGAKKFNEHLSSMVHGLVQETVDARSEFRPSKRTKTRGTSTWCPFCNTRLVHQHRLDRKAICPACNRIYYRDLLSALANKVRRLTGHERDTPQEHWKQEHAQYRWCRTAWDVLPEDIVYRIQRKVTVKVLPHERLETCVPTFEQHVWEVPVHEDGGLLPNAAQGQAEATPVTSGTVTNAVTTTGSKQDSPPHPHATSEAQYRTDACNTC